MTVYVLDIYGQPLMPIRRCGKVRRLLNSNKAKVVHKEPFTIQLLFETQNNVSDLTLGVDTGSKHVGTAVISNGNVIYQSQVELRTDIKDKMTTRRKYRRDRRNRKTRYRKPRFLNRANSAKKDRLPPSVKHKVQAHVDEIEFVKSILPISQIVLEVSQFDTHLMKNPALALEQVKHWGYQKGFNYGYSSKRDAILNRDKYTCQYCKGRHKDSRLEVHHIVYRSQGGSDDESNLITLCHTCHTLLHDGLLKESEAKLQGKVKGSLHHATHMSIIRSQLLKRYPNAIETYGFVTKENRNHMHLPKDHYIDACVIASGGESFNLSNEIFYKRRVAKGDYQLSKGVRSEQIIPVGKIKGFRKFDKVQYRGKEYFIKGRMSSGYAVLMDIFGNKQVFSNPKTVKLEKCERKNSRCSTLIQRAAIHPLG